MGIGSQLNTPPFHLGTFLPNHTGYTVLAGKFDEHTRLALLLSDNPRLRQMPLGAGRLLG
jgi:hypothetical protein